MTLAIAARVARQLRHDPRTLALVTFVPSILAWLVHQIFDGEEPISSQVEMTLLAMFPLLLMFLLTAVATVRERSGGTLERLMAAPIHKIDVIGGYALAYGALAIAQTSLLTAVCYWGLDMQLRGGIVWMLLVSLATALLGIALGLLAMVELYSMMERVRPPSIAGFLTLIALPWVAYRRLDLNTVAAFWIAYTLTRPLGASVADWLSVPAPYGDGLQLGTGPMSLVFGVVLLVVVGAIAHRHRPDADR